MLKKLIGKKNCKFCKEELTKDNFSYLSVDLNSCTRFACLFLLHDELENKRTETTQNEQ